MSTKLYHILAVSGAHVAYINLGIVFFLDKFKMNKKTEKSIVICLLIFFMFLTGFTPSVVRACTMAIIMLIADILNRKLDLINSISLSLLIILIDNPFIINNLGLELSYGGTIGIILYSKRITSFLEKKLLKNDGKFNKIKKSIINTISVTLSAQIMIFPITIINFNTINLNFLISNLFAGYLMGIITILGFLFVIISSVFQELSIILKTPLEIFLNAFMLIAKYSSKIPYSNYYIITPPIFLVVFYYIFLILNNYLYILKTQNHRRYFQKKLEVFIKKITLKRISIFIIVIIIFIQFIKLIPQDLIIYFIDVGQGDSTLIITPHGKKILIDTGGSKDREGYDVGENTLVPYLLDRQIKRLDYLVVTHFDTDHCNGAISVLNKLKVEKLIISEQGKSCNEYEKIMKLVKDKKIRVIKVKVGDKISFEKDVYFEVLHPQKDLIQENILNNNSIVGKLKYKSFSMLFTGDIEEIAENELIKIFGGTNKLNSSILKVGHHGSKTSSTKEFLQLVKPQIALIGVGENNTFGHPSNITLENLKQINCKVYRTDENGEITIKVNSNGNIDINKKIK